MTQFKRAFYVLAITGLINAASAQAVEFQTVVIGGKGGGKFVLHCPAGTLLTGLSSR